MITFSTSSSEDFTVSRSLAVCSWNRLAWQCWATSYFKPHTFAGCHPNMMTLKPPSSSPICSSKSLKSHNYGKALYIVSSYCQSPEVNLFARLFTWYSQSKLTCHVSITYNMTQLWNLLTINLKDESFHNSVEWSRLYLQVNNPSLEKKFRFTVFRLPENAFCETPFPLLYNH